MAAPAASDARQQHGHAAAARPDAGGAHTMLCPARRLPTRTPRWRAATASVQAASARSPMGERASCGAAQWRASCTQRVVKRLTTCAQRGASSVTLGGWPASAPRSGGRAPRVLTCLQVLRPLAEEARPACGVNAEHLPSSTLRRATEATADRMGGT